MLNNKNYILNNTSSQNIIQLSFIYVFMANVTLWITSR